MTPIFLGGLIGWLADRALSQRKVEASSREVSLRNGLLFAAGLITGEALMGIAIAIPIVSSGQAEVLALPGALHFGEWLGLCVLSVLALALYRTAVRKA
jgi:hypothetical protein